MRRQTVSPPQQDFVRQAALQHFARYNMRQSGHHDHSEGIALRALLKSFCIGYLTCATAFGLAAARYDHPGWARMTDRLVLDWPARAASQIADAMDHVLSDRPDKSWEKKARVWIPIRPDIPHHKHGPESRRPVELKIVTAPPPPSLAGASKSAAEKPSPPLRRAPNTVAPGALALRPAPILQTQPASAPKPRAPRFADSDAVVEDLLKEPVPWRAPRQTRSSGTEIDNLVTRGGLKDDAPGSLLIVPKAANGNTGPH